MTMIELKGYVEEVLNRIAHDRFGQRDAPEFSLSADTRELPHEGLTGTLEVHIRTRTGESPLIHAESFAGLKSRDEVDDLFGRVLSVVLMRHPSWPR